MNFIKKYNIYYNIPVYLILLFPLFFILGPTFVEITSFIIIIFFFKSANKKFYINNIFYINVFLCFYLYLIFRSFFFSFDFEKIKSIVFYFRYLFFTCAIVFFISRIDSKKSYFVNFIFIIFFILILDSIFQYYYGKNILNIPLNDPHRPSSFFGNELILGSFLFRFLPFICMCLLLLKFNLKNNILKLSIFFSLYFFAVLISGERTSFFLLLLTILLLIILVKDFRKILLCGLIFFLFINLIFSFSNKNPYDRMLKQTFSQMISQKVDSKVDLELDSKLKENLGNLELNNKINSFSNNYVFSREHQGHYIIALRMFLDNPIFGQGPRSFRYLCSEDRFIKSDGICTTHPHNTYLQLLAETGLIGFLFIFVLFLFTLKELFRKFFKNFKHQNRDNNYVQIKYISLIAIFVSLFPLAPSGNFFNNWLSFVYYYPIAFYIYSINKSKN
jgi:O-antigen ligase